MQNVIRINKELEIRISNKT